MKNKPIKFETRIFHKGNVYLKLSDVSKALGYRKQSEFLKEHMACVSVIPSIGRCVNEAVYNDMISENSEALSKQGQIEITKVDTLRSKIDSVMDFQSFKFLFAKDYIRGMAIQNGCLSEEEYLLKYEVPGEKRKALEELIDKKADNTQYSRMLEYINDREKFDVEHIKKFGLDIQVLSSIDCMGKATLEVYVVGVGVFCNITDFGDYEEWNEMCIDDNGNVTLPVYDYDSKNPKETFINLSSVEIKRDFSKYNVIQNMLWCMENLNVDALEDYEYSVFDYDNNAGIRFSMPIALLVKLIKPDVENTIYTDKVLDIEKELFITQTDETKVFSE